MLVGYTDIDQTYDKRVQGGSYTQVWLDQALLTPEWTTIYPMANVWHVHATCSVPLCDMARTGSQGTGREDRLATIVVSV